MSEKRCDWSIGVGGITMLTRTGEIYQDYVFLTLHLAGNFAGWFGLKLKLVQ